MRDFRILGGLLVGALLAKGGGACGVQPGPPPAESRAAPSTLIVDPTSRRLARARGNALELGRLVEDLGDEPIVAYLGVPQAPTRARLAAIDATRWLRAPEEALQPLASLASGRDEALAAAAAQALLIVTEQVTASELTRREVRLEDLGPALRTLKALGADETARGDIRQAARVAEARLGQLESL